MNGNAPGSCLTASFCNGDVESTASAIAELGNVLYRYCRMFGIVVLEGILGPKRNTATKGSIKLHSKEFHNCTLR